MAKECNNVRNWVIDKEVVSTLNRKPVTCEEYITALEYALDVAVMTDCEIKGVLEVRKSLGIGVA